MITVRSGDSPPAVAPLGVTYPPLQNGDEMGRVEFHRRYLSMPYVKKAELIDGVVHMPSPLQVRKHGSPDNRLATILGYYEAETAGVLASANCSVPLDEENEVQPDRVLLIEPACGGQAALENDFLTKSPEWVGEISASSASIDLGRKLRLYERSGVQEYLVWRVYDEQIDYFIAREGVFQRLDAEQGVFRSEAFAGLWIDANALLRGDMKQALARLMEGIATADHQQFVKRLETAKSQM